MENRRWLLTDVEQDVSVEALELGADELNRAGTRPITLRKRTLRGGLRDGVEVVEVNNGRCRFVVVPSRGMGIWRAWLDDVPFGWKAPVHGPIHPRNVPLLAPDGLGWLQGFDELLCRCGLENNGAPVFDDAGRLQFPLHGRIANTPAHRLEVTWDEAAAEIAITGVVDEARLFHSKLRLTSTLRTRAGEAGFRIQDEVTNLSATDAEAELLYHVNFGPPLLEAGARVVLPVERLVPYGLRAAEGIDDWDRYAPPTPGFAEQVYLCRLATTSAGDTQAMLVNSAATSAARLRFNHEQLPTFTLWKSTESESDGYVTGLEPGISFPNPRPFESEHGRTARLEPGASRTASLAIDFLNDAEQVAEAQAEIAKLQSRVTPRIETAPAADWTPDG